MTAEEQLILTLCEIEERSVREVADLTGWSESNVKFALSGRGRTSRQSCKPAMNDKADRDLDALLAAVRQDVPDTGRAEFAFETRLLARLGEERGVFGLPAALSPGPGSSVLFFAALALAAGLWSRTPTAGRTRMLSSWLRCNGPARSECCWPI
jgi:hypothetical protein